MKTRPVLWSFALAAAVVLAGCNKHDTSDNDTMPPAANTAPATTATAPAMTPTEPMPPAAATAPATSSSAMMPPPTLPATSGSTGH